MFRDEDKVQITKLLKQPEERMPFIEACEEWLRPFLITKNRSYLSARSAEENAFGLRHLAEKTPEFKGLLVAAADIYDVFAEKDAYADGQIEIIPCVEDVETACVGLSKITEADLRWEEEYTLTISERYLETFGTHTLMGTVYKEFGRLPKRLTLEFPLTSFKFREKNRGPKAIVMPEYVPYELILSILHLTGLGVEIVIVEKTVEE